MPEQWSDLTPAAQDLVRRRLTGALTPDQTSPNRSLNSDRDWPLTADQMRLWFLHELKPGRTDYNVAACWRATGPLDLALLDKALVELVIRHEALRLTMPTTRGIPSSRATPPPRSVLTVHELGSVTDAEDEAERIARQYSEWGFDLANGPLYRFWVLRINPEHHVFGMVVHHIVIDRESLGILSNELISRLLGGNSNDLVHSVRSTRFVEHATRATGNRSISKIADHQFWTAALEGVDPILDVATDFPRPEVLSGGAGEVTIAVDEETTHKCLALASEEKTTAFVVGLAAFSLLLHRYASANTFTIGCPFSARSTSDVEDVVGFFARSLPVPCRWTTAKDLTFRQLVRETRRTFLDVHEHQHLPLEEIVSVSDAPHEVSRNPLFQVWYDLSFAVNSGPLGTQTLNIESCPYGVTHTRFDIEMHITVSAENTSVRVLYSSDLFLPESMQSFAQSFVRLLVNGLRDPDVRALSLPLMESTDLANLTHAWHASRDAPRHELGVD